MTTTAVPATRLKPGDSILLDGQGDEIFRVKKISISAPGKHGHSKVNIDYANIFTGSGGNIVLSGHHDVHKPVIEKERAQVLSVIPKQTFADPKIPTRPAVVQLMNLTTYETYELTVPEEIDEKELQAGIELEVRTYSSKKWIEKIVTQG